MSISKSNALQSTNSPHVKWEQPAVSRRRGLWLGLRLGLGIFAFAIITINTICRAIPILLAKHGSMGQSDEQKFNALWKTATTTIVANKTTTITTVATLEDSQNEIQLICSSNWQTVIICHVYGDTGTRSSQSFVIHLTLPFILITWTVHGWQLFYFFPFCHSIFAIPSSCLSCW